MMDYFKRWDGFTGAEAAELSAVFKRLSLLSPCDDGKNGQAGPAPFWGPVSNRL